MKREDTTSSSISLTPAEQDLICEILKRNPNNLELEIFSRLWSEHASYKNSLQWLRKLPTSGANVIVEAGDESAGAIDIGDGYACVFKIESHNHPCSFQPRLGALTGMRLVTRDVITMGAKPVAILDALRFGEADRDTARWLFGEVISGIQEFEHIMKIPVIGGEVYFDKGFNSSPIVNNMAVGIAPKNELISGVAKGEGNLILVVGALTGNDGVDEDAFAADFISESKGNSFGYDEMMDSSIERNLLYAIKDLMKSNAVVGAEAIGAGGIVGTATEMASRGQMGLSIYLDKVPLRDDDMTARQIMLSETWGRVLLCIKKDKLAEVKDALGPKQLSFAEIGVVEKGESVKSYYHNEILAEIPYSYVGLGGKAPIYDREIKEPESQQIVPLKIEDVDEPTDIHQVLSVMLHSFNLSSKEQLMEEFDPELQHDSFSEGFPSDAAFVHLDEIQKTLAISIDCNPYYVEADPFVGTQIAVAEAARNIICGGGIPLAVTDCLNFGNPYDPEVFWQFTQAIEGLADACAKLNTPIVSGNVSFYNQKSIEGRLTPVIPSPIIGMVGEVEKKEHHSVINFKHKGDMIFLVGKSRNDINASEYLNHYHQKKSHAAPYFNFEEELEIQEVVKQIIRKGFVRSVHDVSSGGLFFTLLESALPLELGFDITSDAEIRKDAFLFGESQSRVVVTVAPKYQDEFVDFMLETETNFSALGHVTRGEIRIDDESYGFVDEIKRTYNKIFNQWMYNQE